MDSGDFNSLRAQVKGLEEEIRLLKDMVQWHMHLIRFHKFDEIDPRYAKGFYGKWEYPFYETKERHKERASRVMRYRHSSNEFVTPIPVDGYDHKECRLAVDRMKVYLSADPGKQREAIARAKCNSDEIDEELKRINFWKNLDEKRREDQ